jgi:hypothetical protein
MVWLVPNIDWIPVGCSAEMAPLDPAFDEKNRQGPVTRRNNGGRCHCQKKMPSLGPVMKP